MAKLSEITKGARVRGIAGDAAVTIKDTEWHGDSVLSVTYKTDQGPSARRHKVLFAR